MAPEYEKAAQTLKGEMRLAKIDTERHPDASVRWNIRGIPTLILFAHGREVTRQAGARPAQAIAEFARQAAGRAG
ncbi:MAG: thioredoxin domain-containing protein, partial [Paracoccus sp. (in: a-proteobacteria)]|nr:thioredoxin domain-containing protein [Paracoccus sp. (in: a-proteobacteria)]